MSTIADLIDKTYRTYLEPPDQQAASTRLDGALDASQQSVVLHDFDVPEDINLVRAGSLLEFGSELSRVVDWDAGTRAATVLRGQDGTTATTHLDDAIVKLSPPFPRQTVFEAVRDNIVSLYPKLWTTTTEYLSPVAPKVFPIEDDLVVAAVEVTPDGYLAHRLTGHIVEDHYLTGGRTLVTNVLYAHPVWARMRRRFGVATAESDTLDSLGLESVWEGVVMMGAAADMLAGRDVSESHVDWVGAVLKAENIRPGTKSSLAVALARYRLSKLNEYAKEMKGEESNGVRVDTVNPWMEVSG